MAVNELRLFKLRNDRWMWKVMGTGKNALAIGCESHASPGEAREAAMAVYKIMKQSIERVGVQHGNAPAQYRPRMDATGPLNEPGT